MKHLSPSEFFPKNLAYLEDRVLTAQGKPQLYGTQFQGEGKTFGPQPIEDEEHLDERRACVGLSHSQNTLKT